MNFFEKFLYLLQSEMERPKPWGWFHLLWISIVVILIVFLYKTKEKHDEKRLKIILLSYGFISLLLETIKQVIWSFEYDFIMEMAIWDYPWYIFPFQFCSTPMYISIICFFMNRNKIRTALLSYIAFVTILGSFMTILIPDSCFTKTIEVNIHTMYLHCMSFVLSIYLFISGEIAITKENLKNGFKVFLLLVGFANILNIIIYNSGILGDESFNMFYVSPYFESSLPIFVDIQKQVPYIIFLELYIFAIGIGSYIVYKTAKILIDIYKELNLKKSLLTNNIIVRKNK